MGTINDSSFRPKMGDQAPLYQKAGLGLFCGGVGQFLANPFDLVKVQMQAEGRRRLQGLPPRVEVGKHNFRYSALTHSI